MSKKKTQHLIFLFIAFSEGATVMACELLGAKMTAPFFGTTLYTWAAVLAITLGGLALGYFIGGWLSSKYKPVKLLQWVLISSGLFMIGMPFLAESLMKTVISLNLLTGLMISLSIYLLPPVLLFGMVSPIIVSATVDEVQNSGKVAGRVYAISTFGGVISTLLLGFAIIPRYGIQWPSVAFGLFLLAIALIFIVDQKRLIKAMILLAISGVTIKLMADRHLDKKDYIYKIHSSSEGLLGQVKVADYSLKTPKQEVIPVRGLLVNNTWQTVIHRESGVPLLDYIYFIRPLLSAIPPQSDVLLVGLGGGALCREIVKKKHKVEVVELDKRLPKLGKKFFGLHPQTTINVDDGRHFIRTSERKYDMVVLDVFLGENPPWHLLTQESFEEIQSILNDNGLLLIEFYGYLHGENGKAARSIYKTLLEAGFKTEVIATDSIDGIERNFVFVAGNMLPNYSSLDYSGEKYTEKRIVDLNDYKMDAKLFSMEESTILTDDLPSLERMLLYPALAWRNQLNKHFRDRFVSLGQPLFY